MMKSFSREKNIWRISQGPILHVLIARSWFYSHRSPLGTYISWRPKEAKFSFFENLEVVGFLFFGIASLSVR